MRVDAPFIVCVLKTIMSTNQQNSSIPYDVHMIERGSRVTGKIAIVVYDISVNAISSQGLGGRDESGDELQTTLVLFRRRRPRSTCCNNTSNAIDLCLEAVPDPTFHYSALFPFS